MNNRPFIPAWLDDAGLSQAEFRLYCHLCRRADKKTGLAWPQAESIARDCSMARNTVWKSIRSLEAKGFIRRVGKSFAGSNRYRVMVPTIGANEAPIDTSPNQRKSEPPIGANESHQSAQMDSREGSPTKFPQRRSSSDSGFRRQASYNDSKSKNFTAAVNTGRRKATIEEA